MQSYRAMSERGSARSNSRELVVGGEAAVAFAYPFVVRLLSFDSLTCGGSLVAAHWVLTAAHCVDNAWGGLRTPQQYSVEVQPRAPHPECADDVSYAFADGIDVDGTFGPVGARVVWRCTSWRGFDCARGGWGVESAEEIAALLAACPASCADGECAECAAETIPVAALHCHEAYSKQTLENDICLLELAHAPACSVEGGAIALDDSATCTQPASDREDSSCVGTVGTVAGFGATAAAAASYSYGAPLGAGELRYARVPVRRRLRARFARTRRDRADRADHACLPPPSLSLCTCRC